MAWQGQTSIRTSPVWVVSAYFNPAGYHSKILNLQRFVRALQLQGVPYTIVEMAYGSSQFTLPRAPGVIQLRGNDVMWQKERLINLAISQIPSDYEYIAWLDCDVIFEDDDWSVRAAALLQSFAVIQPFDWSVRLPQGHEHFAGEGAISPSFAYAASQKSISELSYAAHGRTGFAWIGRRDWLGAYGLYDAFILGGADHFMAHIFAGDSEGTCVRGILRGNSFLQRHALAWGNRVLAQLRERGGLGVLSGRLFHLWHGETEYRGYSSRQDILRRELFDPENDITVVSNGVWKWATSKPNLHLAVETYFGSRREDDPHGSHIQQQGTIFKNTMRATTITVSKTISSRLHLPIRPPRELNLADELTVYDWNTGSEFLLPRLVPGAKSISANPRDTAVDILTECQDRPVFAFHVNLSETNQFPLCRPHLEHLLRTTNICILNERVKDIRKRTVQSHCRAVGLGSVSATKDDGAQDDLLIVKTNLNYAGIGERKLSHQERADLGIAMSEEFMTIEDYRVLRRSEIPNRWWTDHTLAIEHFIENEAGRKYRSYFAGQRHVIAVTSHDSRIKKFQNALTLQYHLATHRQMTRGLHPSIPDAVQRSISSFVRSFHIDFGAIDLVEDDSGMVYIVDVNTTSGAKALGHDQITFLRRGLERRIVRLRARTAT